MADLNSRLWNLLFAAWLIALIATLGALFIGEVMGQAPCILCWYQRIFMFPLALILGVALFKADTGGISYALPLSLGGLAAAAFHCLLYFKILPEEIKPCEATGPSCASADMTIFGGVPIPLLSLAAFSIISYLLLTIRRKHSS